MHISRVEFFPLRQPIARAYGDANGMKSHRSTMIIKVATSDGLIGWGECFRARVTAERLREAQDVLEGADPIVGQPLVEVLARREPTLAAGVDIALMDLRGKASGLSIAKLLGGPFRPAQPAYASLQNANEAADPVGDAQEEAGKALQLGFKALKMKVGWHDPATDLAWIRAVLQQLPNDVPLALDANQAMDLATARRLADALPPERIAWFEEPLKNHRLESHQELRSRTRLPIAGAESLLLAQVEAAVRGRCMDIINPDLVGHGGFRRMQHLWSLCESFGVRLIPHVFDGQIVRVATLHFLAAQPDWHERQSVFRAAPVECDISPNSLRDELLKTSLKPDALGLLEVPSGPGLGIEVDEALLTRAAETVVR